MKVFSMFVVRTYITRGVNEFSSLNLTTLDKVIVVAEPVKEAQI